MTTTVANDRSRSWASTQTNNEKGGGLRMRGRKHIIGALLAGLVASMGVVALAAAPASAAVKPVVFRGQATTTSVVADPRVVIPASVLAGDALLLFATTNTLVTATTPAGWTLEGRQQSNTDTQTFLYSKVAVANDAGRNAALTYSAVTKSTLTLLAYSGTGHSRPH